MEFQIAGLRFRVRASEDAALALVCERYAAYAAPFAVPAIRALDLRVAFRAIPSDAVQTGPDVAMERRGGVVRATRVDFDGTVDLDAGRVEVAFAGVGGAQSFLRIACSVVLAPLGGILVHASSVLRGSRAYLFVGESGAGKTTIARLSAPSLILSDEVSAVVPADRSGRGYECHATPFWGDLADGLDDQARREILREQPAAAPLARIFFPRKSAHDAVVPVHPPAAFMELAREAFAFGDDEATTRAITATCGRLAESVPSAELQFRKSPDFWSCIGA